MAPRPSGKPKEEGVDCSDHAMGPALLCYHDQRIPHLASGLFFLFHLALSTSSATIEGKRKEGKSKAFLLVSAAVTSSVAMVDSHLNLDSHKGPFFFSMGALRKASLPHTRVQNGHLCLYSCMAVLCLFSLYC